MLQQDTAVVLLSYQIDQSSVQAAIEANQQVTASMASVVDSAQAAYDAGANLADILASPDAASQLGVTEDVVAQMRDDLGISVDNANALSQSLDNVAVSGANASAATQNIGSGDGGGGDDSEGGFGLPSPRAFTSAGRLLGSQAGGQDVSAIGSVVRLTAAFGPFGLALGAGLVAVNAITAAQENEAKQAQATADAINQIATGAASSTTKSIQDQLADANSKLAVLEQTKATLQAFSDQNDELLKEGAAGILKAPDLFAKANAAAGGTLTDLSKLPAVITDTQTSIDDVTTHISSLNTELGTSAVAANDLQAAQDALTKTQVQSANYAIQAEGLTADQRKQREEQLQGEIEGYQQQINAVGANTDAGQALLATQTDLYNQFEALIGVSNTYGDQLAAEATAKQNLTDATTQYQTALANEVKTRGDIFQTEQNIADLRTGLATDEQAAATDNATKIADIQASAADQQQQITQNNADAIAKIMRTASQNEQQDIFDRDAGKFTQDQQAATNALTDQQVTEAKQLTSQQTSEAKQLASQNASETAKITSLQDAESKKLTVQNQALAQENVDLTNYMAQQVAISSQYHIGIVSDTTHFWQSIESIFASVQARILANMSGSSGGSGGQYGSGTPLNDPNNVAQINYIVDSRIAQTIGRDAGTSSGGIFGGL